ncbi:WD repeat-containing protein 6 [Wyeomyia smithii]|uniref:WD repeat-containing protein 6 n=1 Tax=Wyeomyia smithii TaxID=174621 RepID=UPI002467E3BC|nr:WD repeat-containing protein 6 [Wyeomyia smithii]
MKALTDATCIRVLTSEKVIVGIGNNLVLYYVDAAGKTQKKHACTPRSQHKILDIDFSREEQVWLIVFHANRNIFTTTLSQDNEFSNVISVPLYNSLSNFLYYPEDAIALIHSKHRLNDMISCLKVLDNETICLITGHGVFLLLDRLYSGEWYPNESCPCSDSSTLYCSRIVGTSRSDLVCFSGTALGLLLIWKPTGPQEGQVLSSIPAHNGVIFSISCDLQLGFVATASDDRSVKLWKVTGELREENAIVLEETVCCYGHTARVFHCRLFREAESLWLVSLGEDSNMCLWNRSGSLLVKKRLEEGSTLWNSDYDRASMTLFVSTSNGNVATVCLQDYLKWNEADTSMQTVMVEDLGNDKISKVKFLSDESLVAVTDGGKIIVLRNTGETIDVDQLEATFKCSILETIRDRIFVAGASCVNIYGMSKEKGTTVLLKRVEPSFDREEFQSESEPIKFSMIRSLHFCRQEDFIVCDNNGRCLLYSGDTERLKSFHRLPRSKERWLTSVYAVEDILLLADRAGNLFLYDEHSQDPIDKLPCLHGKLGITDIKLEERTDNGYYFMTSGHDGHLRSTFLDGDGRTLQICGSEKMPINWIDRMYIKPEQFLVGFNENRFVVCDFHKEVLFEIDCGGGHRYWDCIRRNDNGDYKLVCIKHKQLKTADFSSCVRSNSLLKIPRFRCHSKACNVARIVKMGDVCLIISGGEDNLLLVNKFSLETGLLLDCSRGIASSHISSIKSICYSHRLVKKSGNILIISSGGRAQICLITLDVTTLRTKTELSYMLKSSDQDRSRWRSNRDTSPEPETRFMCSVFVESNASLLVGCSDGFLRYFKISLQSETYKVELMKEVNYGRCFLNITKLSIAGKLVFLTMATDGLICFWDEEKMEAPFYQLEHHASGINGFDVCATVDGWFLIGTGGDDQAVVVSKFRLSSLKNGGFCIQLRETNKSKVHLGQVTGIKFQEDATLLSAGIDQMVYRFNVTKLTVSQKWSSCISDIKGIATLPGTSEIFVYGSGFEFIDVIKATINVQNNY